MADCPAHIPGTLSNLQLLAIVGALDGLGYDVDRTLQLAGLPREQFADRAGRTPAGVEFRLWDAALQVSADPTIGLRIGEQLSWDLLGGYGFLLRASESLATLIVHADRYMRVIDDLARVDLEVGDERAVARLHRSGYPIPDLTSDCLCVAISRVMSATLPHADSTLATVRLPHAPQFDRAIYQQHMGCRVEFHTDQIEFDLPRHWLHERMRTADPGLGEVLQDHVAQLLAQLPPSDPFLHNARAALARLFEQSQCSLAHLARAMHLSERTLRRRLSEYDTSYLDLLDELRAALARKLLQRPDRSIDGIAEQLGFSDASSFFHAFKRWTGSTPVQFRRQLRSEF